MLYLYTERVQTQTIAKQDEDSLSKLLAIHELNNVLLQQLQWKYVFETTQAR